MEFNATFLVSIISFIVFTFIMNTIFYKPLGNVIDKRQEFIDETNNEALKFSKEAQEIETERVSKLSKAKDDAKRILNDNVSKANDEAKQLTENAKKQSNEKILSAKTGLHSEAAQAEEILKGDLKEIAEQISQKILGEYIPIDVVNNEIVNKVIN